MFSSCLVCRDDLLELFIGESGGHGSTLGGIVRVDGSERALEGVVARSSWGQVDAKVAANGAVEVIPVVLLGPAVVARMTFAGVVVSLPGSGHPLVWLEARYLCDGVRVGGACSLNGKEERAAKHANDAALHGGSGGDLGIRKLEPETCSLGKRAVWREKRGPLECFITSRAFCQGAILCECDGRSWL